MVKPYYEEKDIKIYCGDCLEIMKEIPDKSVDLILTDPPYGVTQNENDKVVNLDFIFELNCGKIIFSQQPYTTDLIWKYKDKFRYDLIWDKILSSGFLNANCMPLRQHEIILIFGTPIYNPQKHKGNKSHSKGKHKICKNYNYGKFGFVDNTGKLGEWKHPTSILRFSKPHPSIAVHRTEKPIELIRHLVKTYSNENNLILDPFLGSGTTLVACKELGRQGIGIEISKEYCDIAIKRLKETKQIEMNLGE